MKEVPSRNHIWRKHEIFKKELVSENVERNDKKIAIALHDFSGERRSQICVSKNKQWRIITVKKTIPYLFPKMTLSKYIKKIRGGVLGKQGTKNDIFHWNMLQPEDDSIRSKGVIQINYMLYVLSFANDDQMMTSISSAL